ncbi:hypothetical protein ACN47E_005739 [Coniothyrium glycines]
MDNHDPSSTGTPKRSNVFHPAHEPHHHDPALNLQKDRISGPVSFLNPTRAHYRHDARPDIRFKWSSRNNRKGRHAIVMDRKQATTQSAHMTTPRPTSSPHSIGCSIWRMLTNYPFWDISFDVAYVFTIGSVIWVINAFFVWLPLVRPDTEFKNEELYGGGITAFVGATVFEFGSILLLAEAVNENRSGCFGWALDQAASHGGERAGSLVLKPSKSHCTHHHLNKRNLVGTGNHHSSKSETASQARSWIWWPSTTDLQTHYLRSLGFLASLAQLCGASIFWVSGLTALPGIYNRMSTFWGSWAFLIGSVLQWYESLEKFPVEVKTGLGKGKGGDGLAVDADASGSTIEGKCRCK